VCFLKQVKQDSEKVADLEFIRSLKEDHLDEMFTFFARGARRFYQRGTGRILEPDRAQKFRDAYVAEMDVVQEFMNECCKVTATGYTKRTLLYEAYVCWWENSANSGKVMSAKKFYSSLSKKGHRADGKKDRTRVVAGLKIQVSQINI
jgi:phage/plasmid-associated DNA primase